jgi:hypothetical protein
VQTTLAQIWLTQKELAALLMAADSSARVSRSVWAGLEPKLTEARDALGCPVRPHASELKKLSTDRNLAQSC